MISHEQNTRVKVSGLPRQYADHRLVIHGTRVSHLPSLIFLLYSMILAQHRNLTEKPGAPVYDRENNCYRENCRGMETILTPENTTVTLGYTAEESLPRQYCYYVTIEATKLHSPGTARWSVPESPVLSSEAEYNLIRMRVSYAFLQQYYFPVRRFLHANSDKYLLPGAPLPEDGFRIAVLDTEMERPYITQFAGILLQLRDGSWQKLHEYSTYVKLPHGVRLTPYVARVTGFTDRFLAASGIPEREAVRDIASFLQDADLICGHAVLADIEILRLAFERQHTAPPACLQNDRLVDTQVILQYLFGLKSSMTLEHAAALAGIASGDEHFHDAVTDASVTSGVFLTQLPEFIARYHAFPVVRAAMMHAAQDQQTLQRMLGGGGHTHRSGHHSFHREIS